MAASWAEMYRSNACPELSDPASGAGEGMVMRRIEREKKAEARSVISVLVL